MGPFWCLFFFFFFGEGEKRKGKKKTLSPGCSAPADRTARHVPDRVSPILQGPTDEQVRRVMIMQIDEKILSSHKVLASVGKGKKVTLGSPDLPFSSASTTARFLTFVRSGPPHYRKMVGMCGFGASTMRLNPLSQPQRCARESPMEGLIISRCPKNLDRQRADARSACFALASKLALYWDSASLCSCRRGKSNKATLD